MVAVVGTTITPYMQFYLQSAVAEKGIDEEELKLEQLDAIGGAVWTNVIAIFIVVATAATIYATSGPTTIESASEAAQALEPVAGHLAGLLFAIGLFAASVLAATIMPLSHGLRDLRGVRLGVGGRQAVRRRAARSSGSTPSSWWSARPSSWCRASTSCHSSSLRRTCRACSCRSC